jgi:hypothetical protein
MNTLKTKSDPKSWFSFLILKAVDDAPIWNLRGRCTSSSLSSILGGLVWSVCQPHIGSNNCDIILSCVAKNRADLCLLHFSIHL